MRRETAAALNELNRRFYDRYADSFRATRSEPWPGWKRALAAFAEAPRGAAEPAAILDVGCGHGRLARWLAGERAASFRYVGVDSSAALLAAARAQPWQGRDEEFEFRQVDLLAAGLASRLAAGESFDTIAVFGLLHHLPGLANRRRLLAELAGRLRPGGRMAISCWRFGYFERFRRRVIPWEHHNGSAAPQVDPENLEEGDLLLAWGEGAASDAPRWPADGPRRYCHFASDEEAAALVAGSGLRVADTFLSDGEGGELNRYYVLEQPG